MNFLIISLMKNRSYDREAIIKIKEILLVELV